MILYILPCKDNANERNESLLSYCRVQFVLCKDSPRVMNTRKPMLIVQSFPFYYDYIITSYSQSYFNLILCYTFMASPITLDIFP